MRVCLLQRLTSLAVSILPPLLPNLSSKCDAVAMRWSAICVADAWVRRGGLGPGAERMACLLQIPCRLREGG